MLVEQLLIKNEKVDKEVGGEGFDLVFAFAEGDTLGQPGWFDKIKNILKRDFSKKMIFYCLHDSKYRTR